MSSELWSEVESDGKFDSECKQSSLGSLKELLSLLVSKLGDSLSVTGGMWCIASITSEGYSWVKVALPFNVLEIGVSGSMIGLFR